MNVWLLLAVFLAGGTLGIIVMGMANAASREPESPAREPCHVRPLGGRPKRVMGRVG